MAISTKTFVNVILQYISEQNVSAPNASA